MKTNSDLEIIPYVVDDQINEVRALMDLFLESTFNAHRQRSIDPGAIHDDYVHKLLRDPKARFLVTKVKSKIVGFVMARILDEHEENEILMPQCVWIHSLYVLPEFRKQGIAEKMLHKVEEWCRSLDIEFLRLNLMSNNSAKQLYEKLNFKIESVIMEKHLHGHR